MAALDYSVEKQCGVYSSQTSASIFRHFAARVNRKIIYLPLGQLSPTKLKKIRVVHVLDSHNRRAQAKGYIW